MTPKRIPDEELAVLHRHWMWANIMRTLFDEELKKEKPARSVEVQLADCDGAYMCLWYGMLYGVLETIQRENYDVPGIDDAKAIMDSLRTFRNAVFHPQAKYWPEKFMGILQDPNSVKNIRTVHTALGKFFLEEACRRIAARGDR